MPAVRITSSTSRNWRRRGDEFSVVIGTSDASKSHGPKVIFTHSEPANNLTNEVAEEATEAAAATAIEMRAKVSAAPRPVPTPEPFRVDRPFLFYVVDDTTGAILFQGRTVDPRQALASR
jgi:hypothetical protein